MNIRQLTASLVAFALTAATAVYAEEIYKWTDDDGNVHYGDRPSGSPTEERLQISSSRTSSSAVSRRVQSYQDATAAREEAREERKSAEASAAAERQAAEEQAQRCAQMRAQLKTMLEARRVYREGDDGERVYLDEQQRDDARAKAEEQISENCT